MTRTPSAVGTPWAGTRSDRLAVVLADLATEGDILEAMVAPLGNTGWRTATPAKGWQVAHQIAHLAWTDQAAVMAAADKPAWDEVVLAALSDPDGFVDAAAIGGAADDPTVLLARWRSSRNALAETLAGFPEGERIPWFGPAMSPISMATARLMETWAHGVDVADALDVPVTASDRLRHVVHLGVRTRDFAFAVHGLEAPKDEFRIELAAPDGLAQWVYGPEGSEQVVRGSAYDFCLLVTQRRKEVSRDLSATGADAEQWLDIAQAFAGPPGAGPAARSGDSQSGDSR